MKPEEMIHEVCKAYEDYINAERKLEEYTSHDFNTDWPEKIRNEARTIYEEKAAKYGLKLARMMHVMLQVIAGLDTKTNENYRNNIKTQIEHIAKSKD